MMRPRLRKVRLIAQQTEPLEFDSIEAANAYYNEQDIPLAAGMSFYHIIQDCKYFYDPTPGEWKPEILGDGTPLTPEQLANIAAVPNKEDKGVAAALVDQLKAGSTETLASLEQLIDANTQSMLNALDNLNIALQEEIIEKVDAAKDEINADLVQLQQTLANHEQRLQAQEAITIRDKGYFPDGDALRAAYPTGVLGDKALVGNPPTLWRWNPNLNAGAGDWEDTLAGVGAESLDDSPTPNSTKGVTSGGTYTAIEAAKDLSQSTGELPQARIPWLLAYIRGAFTGGAGISINQQTGVITNTAGGGTGGGTTYDYATTSEAGIVQLAEQNTSEDNNTLMMTMALVVNKIAQKLASYAHYNPSIEVTASTYTLTSADNKRTIVFTGPCTVTYPSGLDIYVKLYVASSNTGNVTLNAPGYTVEKGRNAAGTAAQTGTSIASHMSIWRGKTATHLITQGYWK